MPKSSTSGLTAKQEKFAQEWFATGNKTEAYRRSYNCSEWKEHVINSKASTLSTNGKVLARYQELVEAARKRNETTVDVLDKMAKNAWQVAKEDRQAAAMNQSVTVLAKLHGLNQPDKQETNHTGSLSVSTSEMTLDEARALMKENFGVMSGE